MDTKTSGAQDTRSLMESAGFVLRDEREPGVYVRRQQECDSIDWQAGPSDMFLSVQKDFEAGRSKSSGQD